MRTRARNYESKTHKFFENNYQNTCFRQKKIVSLQNVISKIIMARPIKETPTIFYEDARCFEYAVEHIEFESAEKIKRIVETYSAIIAKFPLVL